MAKIFKSMQISELNLKPPIEGAMRLSEDMQQTLALLVGYGIDERKLLRCSESGVLNVVSPRLKDIEHYTGVGTNDTQNGKDIACSEIMVMGHPDNTGLVWVRIGAEATVDNSWPLAKNMAIGFTVDNLKQLSMLIVTAGEKLIVAYTR